jgi:hypothetical protein
MGEKTNSDIINIQFEWGRVKYTIEMENEQHFNATIQKLAGKVMIEIPFRPDEIWGTRERYHITGSINGKTIRGALGEKVGKYYLMLGPAWLRDNGMGEQEIVSVVLRPEGPQIEQLPEDIAVVLDPEDQARAFFESLPTFYRKNFMRWVESAKRPETRAARIAMMVALLKDGKRER